MGAVGWHDCDGFDLGIAWRVGVQNRPRCFPAFVDFGLDWRTSRAQTQYQ